MTFSMADRAEELSPAGSDEEIDAVEDMLVEWIAEQASVVRNLGPTGKTRAVISASRALEGINFECEFYSLRGSCYVLRILADGSHFVSLADTHVLDAVAAISLIAALLQELGMSAAFH